MPTGNAKNRGYEKIKGAVSAFNFDFRGKTVLDIGSSTGGFTQYALDHGAKKVIAIEKGTNQMVKPLRFNKKIELHEKTDIFSVKAIELSSEGNPEPSKARPTEVAMCSAEHKDLARAARSVSEGHAAISVDLMLSIVPDIILTDVSFISLTKVLEYAKYNLANKNTKFLVMLKPQFEARPDQLNKGIIKNEKIRRDIIKNFEQWLKQHEFVILNKRDNSLKGKNGNQERFYYLKLAK